MSELHRNLMEGMDDDSVVAQCQKAMSEAEQEEYDLALDIKAELLQAMLVSTATDHRAQMDRMSKIADARQRWVDALRRQIARTLEMIAEHETTCPFCKERAARAEKRKADASRL